MTAIHTLIAGATYDTSTLVFAGWTDGDGSGHDGYSCWNYFAADGRYLGPDWNGIEPLFAGHPYPYHNTRHITLT